MPTAGSAIIYIYRERERGVCVQTCAHKYRHIDICSCIYSDNYVITILVAMVVALVVALDVIVVERRWQ